jgi:hypothetical protein
MGNSFSSPDKKPQNTQPNNGSVNPKSQSGRGDGQCGGGGNGQCGGGKRKWADHTKLEKVKFHVRTIMFRQSAFTTEKIRAWVKVHFPTKLRGMKLVSKPSGEYIHAILDTSAKSKDTIFRNKKINNDITIGFAK